MKLIKLNHKTYEVYADRIELANGITLTSEDGFNTGSKVYKSQVGYVVRTKGWNFEPKPMARVIFFDHFGENGQPTSLLNVWPDNKT